MAWLATDGRRMPATAADWVHDAGRTPPAGRPGRPTAGPGRAFPGDRATRTAGRRTPRRTHPAGRLPARPARYRPGARPGRAPGAGKHSAAPPAPARPAP